MTLEETMTITALMLAPAFFSLIGMAALGSPIVALLGELAAKSKSKVFYDKYGQQTASMGVILLILLILVEAVGIALLITKYPQHADQVMAQRSAFIPVLAAAGAYFLFGLPYLFLWKKMRNAKGMHIALGIAASIGAISMVALVIPAKLSFTFEGSTVAPEISALFLPMSIMYAIMIIVAAAGLSCAWLVMRRNKDDFGRDYYNFSLPLAARWAFIPMIGFLVCQGWLFIVLPETIKAMVTGTPLGIVWAVGAGLSLLCAIIWLLIARSQTPLRLKGLAFLNIFFMWMAHTANVVVFFNFMSM
jgi:heme/copper-type cytochrome/quinol oxidase subunit 2